MKRPLNAAHDDQLLSEMAALARLVDGAWELTRKTQPAPIDDRSDVLPSKTKRVDIKSVDIKSSDIKTVNSQTVETVMDEYSWSMLRVEVLANMGQSPVMGRLKQQFHLDHWQLALLGLCALPQIEPRYQAVYADLNPTGQPVACLELLLNLLCPFPQKKRQWLHELLSHSALIHWRLLRFPASTSLTETYVLTTPVWLSPDLLSLFMGSSASDTAQDLGGCLLRLPPLAHPCPPVTDQPPPASARLVQVHGEVGAGRRTLAQTLAGERPVFQMDGELLLQHNDAHTILIDCLCHITLNEGDMVWPEGMTLLKDKAGLAAILGQWLMRGSSTQRCWLVETEQQLWPAILASLSPFSLHLDRPHRRYCTALWQSLADHYLVEIPVDDPSLWATVATHYQLLPGTMLQVILALKATAHGQPLTAAEVFKHCLEQTPVTLSGLATRVTPTYGLDDVIVNHDTHQHLQEIIHRYQQRDHLYAQKLSATRGLLALFWGKPGTGKTMVAEALSDALQLPLYKANLASISSKWIGETEKHLSALFDEAERHNGLLFFDEADAVFSRRSQVESSHDKNANLGVSYLLQRMEHFHGLLVLATNFKGNLDPAFMRRMHFSVEFMPPDEQDRLIIWQHWLGKVHTQGRMDEAWLAKHLELSGAQIRNIVQHSASQSIGVGDGLITRATLARAIYRESQKNDNSFLMSTRLSNWYDLRSPHQTTSSSAAFRTHTDSIQGETP